MDTLPWYRQFWPWFLFGLPGIVVVAGLSTWWIAERGSDHLVADDYYKDGLAINREIHKQQNARQLGLTARLHYADGILEVELGGNSKAPALILYMSHPMDARADFSLSLPRIEQGLYRTRLEPPSFPRWLWQLEPAGPDYEGAWRIDGELVLNDANAS
ncbi:MAG: FixH family protein [Halieaceae bacterium]